MNKILMLFSAITGAFVTIIIAAYKGLIEDKSCNPVVVDYDDIRNGNY